MRDERGSERRRPGQHGGRREGSSRPAAHSPNRPSGPEPKLDIERARAEVERFVDLALREMHLELEREIRVSGESDAAEILVRFHGADEALLIENNAELLTALEHVAHRWLRLDPRLHDRVRFDCAEYRATALEELKLAARVAAQRVRETGQEFQFNPMSARERRIIHLELSGAAGVRTMSEGMGDRRYLVIYPATRPSNKPPHSH
jgi:spoIIIJ-associated protein